MNTGHSSHRPLTKSRLATLIVCALLALKLALLFALAWHSRFVMDEFGQLGYAKYLGRELFDTIWPVKAIGFQIFIKPALLIGSDATAVLLIGRMQTALLACGTLALIYAIARTIGEDRLRALIIVLVVLCFSNFMERAFRTIAEPLALFFAAASLWIALRGKADQAFALLGAGLLGGLSFLATQKAVYFNVALGLALVGDAWLAREWIAGARRGALLVLGWLIAVLAYCVIFGDGNPVPVARNLVFGPVEVASAQIAAEYGGLRRYVLQTLERNAPLYLLCIGGLVLESLRLRKLGTERRLTLIFTTIVTVLVFAHNQPWPYVFILAIPFLALWVLTPIDRLAEARRVVIGAIVFCMVFVVSLSRDAVFWNIDNGDQLRLIANAEALLAPGDTYFDGIDMLPTRNEPSTLWLDRHTVLKTLREGRESEAYRIFEQAPPKLVIWSYRLDAVEPLIRPLISDSYIQIAPNMRIAGRRLKRDHPVVFDVPSDGRYALYGPNGEPVKAVAEVAGRGSGSAFDLKRGTVIVRLVRGSDAAMFLPQGDYLGRIKPGSDNPHLFDGVYD